MDADVKALLQRIAADVQAVRADMQALAATIRQRTVVEERIVCHRPGYVEVVPHQYGPLDQDGVET